ncbi:MAG: hypothetical protein FJW40_25520, partial [Acidobacteria bacterium]|nr:hypothetical protein [Acidobacteriota bacterium]
MSAPVRPVVVLLVDNRTRDLAVASLLAHHLRQLGVEPQLQPLEAYQGVLAAYRPAMVVTNHLTASHLVRWSHRLHALGVLVGVLPNEGISYDPDDLRFMAGRYHNHAHIDHFFTWNEPHRHALQEAGFTSGTQIHVVGVPRFDFYFPPWSRLFAPTQRPAVPTARRRVLCCTNFVFAKFRDLPRVEGEKFLQVWRRVPKYQRADPWQLVEINHRARQQSLAFFEALLAAPDLEVLLRPHPLEDASFFRRWADRLPAELRSRLQFDSASNITKLILECDVEVSCETCTTAMESWIAGKPTVELTFERHPAYFHPEIGALNHLCGAPAEVVATVRQALAAPPASAIQALRAAHLHTWCNTPAGDSAERIAKIIAAAVARPAGTFAGLTLTDHRRALKLKALNTLGLPYHYDPVLPLKR